MTALAFAAPDYATLVEALLADPRESCAVIFTRRATRGKVALRWMAASIEIAPEVAYVERTRITSALSAAYVLDVANRARAGGFGLCIVHTHPHDRARPQFSTIDDLGERALAAYLGDRVGGGPHLAMVIGHAGQRARVLGTQEEVGIVEVGPVLRDLTEPSSDDADERYDRQIRAFGRAGQAALQRLKVGVVGLGGTGSLMVQQLAHLGVEQFILIDPDRVERSNLSRVVGARPTDVGAAKVAVAGRQIKRINSGAKFQALAADVVDTRTARILLGCDLVFLCTDSDASRAVVGQIAYQYLIPTVDMGVSISVRGGAVAFVTGRVQMLAPGLPCLVCVEALDPEQVRRELLTPRQRAADPYIVGHHEPQPAVISLNATVSSLAVTMALGAVTPAPAKARFQIYDGINGTVRNLARAPTHECFVCSRSGALLKGDSWPLPTRDGL